MLSSAINPFIRNLLVVFALLLVSINAYSANTITAARVWPAQDYTRITLESETPIKHQLIILKNPDRLVLDIENIDLNSTLKTLSDKILASDPYIKQVRVANFKPNVVRVAVDLKGEVKPNIFALTPAGEYKYRLVLDIYPLQDELMAMLGKKSTADATEAANEVANQPKPIVEPLPPNAGDITETIELPGVSTTTNPTSPTNPAVNTEPAITAETPIKNKEDPKLITIAIDAGHGGEDPGARGANGSHEKVITLAIAKKLKAKIDAESNMRGVLTRDGDYFVPLGMRVVKARKLRADLFVSIHADAFTNPAANGSSVFALSEKGATSAGARYLAKKENESDLIGGVSLGGRDPVLARTLLDLSQTAMINDSLKLGKAVLAQIGDINKLHKNHVEQAGFAVLKSPDIPSILVETAFISNPEEERRLNDEAYQDKLVNSILNGIKKYFSTQPAFARN
ncbi:MULTISPECIES: N-acetylmuramoyl-L-alanine amidase [Methylotenera]|uniref:N-acetylmuramoyl-L-alanine amidase n=1 Tax=Methylotenera TaxID=359407 RepID=UPI0003686FDF|nr:MULTISPECIES: N-acetylmuramoyl-L-alanine amidase [Methylotenera]